MSHKPRKQTAVPLKVKMQLLQAVDAGGASKTSICQRFGIPNSTLSTIIKNRQKLTYMAETSKFDPERKRLRASKYEDLEDALLIWLQQSRSQNAPMFGPGAGAVVMAKANDFATKMGIEFKSNSGWLERFKKRKSIDLKDSYGETKQISNELTADWETSTLPTLLQNHAAKDIFKVEISALFYSCLPEDTLTYNDKRRSGETTEERLTAMIAFNSDGSEKLPVLVVGKLPKSHVLENIKKLKVEYAASKTASMTAKIFTEWLTALDGQFSRENRKVVFIVDDCLARPPVEEFKAVKTILLPTNRTGTSQPRGRQGIISTLKKNYRTLLLQKYLASMETEQEFGQISMSDAMHMLGTAWKSVSPRTIEEWCRKKFSLPPGFENCVKEEEEEEDEPTLGDMFERASFILDFPPNITLSDYVGVDDDVSPVPILTDRDIIDVIRAIPQDNKDSDESLCNDNDGEMTIPNESDIRGKLDRENLDDIQEIVADTRKSKIQKPWKSARETYVRTGKIKTKTLERCGSGLTESNLLQFLDSAIDPDDSFEESVDASEQILDGQNVADSLATSSQWRGATNKRKRIERSGSRRGETLNSRKNEIHSDKMRNEKRTTQIKETVEHLVNLLKAADEDEDKSFLVSLLPTLKTFDTDQKLTFRSQVLQLVMSIKNTPMSNNIVYSTQTTNTNPNHADPLSTQSATSSFMQQTPASLKYFTSPVYQSPSSGQSSPTLTIKYERKSPIIYDSDSSD